MTTKTNPKELSIEERRKLLRYHIGFLVHHGYRVVSQTDTSAQLVKPKSFGCLWASLWFLVFGIGLLFYLFYYWAKKDRIIFISVDEYGKVIVTGN